MARLFVADHPLALLVDIDGLRTQLGHWDRREESRMIARDLALALTEAHLASGYDVVIPQYVGRIEFVEQLAGLAQRCGADFVEVVLVMEASVSVERFRGRRAELESAGTPHPGADVKDADIDRVVHEALDRLADICGRRPSTRRVPADPVMEVTYAALLRAISAPTR